jgi:hypothetical protein
MHVTRGIVLSIGVILSALGRSAAAQGTTIVHGRVTDVQKQPIAAVEVTITGSSTGTVQNAKTDAKGEYRAAFRDAEESFTLSFRKLGYGAYIRSAQRAGLSTIVEVGDAILPGGLQVLQPLVTRTILKVPSRGETPSVGSAELNLANTGLFASDPSDLNALAGLLPGVMSTDSGFSVLGASPGQNKVQVDGSDFAGTNLPRDAIAGSAVVTNTFDPSKGQFAGAETVVTTKPGSDFFAATIRAQLIDPHLAWGDPDAPLPVPRIEFSSGYITGPIVKRKLNYIASYDVSDRATDAPTLLAPRPSLLSQLGVAADSIAVARGAFSALGIPATTAAIPGSPTLFQGSAIGRVDYRVNSLTSFTFSATANWNWSNASGIGELATPTTSGEQQNHFVRYLLKGGTYVHRILEDLSVSLTPQANSSTPYLSLPAGAVLVGTTYADGRSGLTAFRFGGSGSGTSESHTNSFDLNNELSWATADTHNQIKFTQELRSDWGHSVRNGNRFGTFTYQSLTDLAANLPSSYSQTLSSSALSWNSTVAALSLGDIWRAIPGKLDFEGGIRYDSRRFTSAPPYNATADSLFGIRTDHLPADRGFAPRLGFSWRPGGRRNNALPDGMTVITPGGGGMARGSRAPLDAAGIALLAGNDVTLSGGIGAYRGTIAPSRIGALADATGLASTTEYLSCVGTATPVPDWTTLEAAPLDRCADGAMAATDAATQPRITVFDPAFRAPVSWRGTLQLTGWRLGGWAVAPQLTLSTGTNAESWVDRNLNQHALFTLPDEANRPVYANASDIVPETGFFAPTASRRASQYGEVVDITSDLQYHAAELTVAAAPPKPLFGRVPIYFVYSYNRQRSEERGFGGTTAGDPFAVDWIEGRQPMHQFIVGAANIKLWWFTLAARFNLLSGVPYTPVVAQDINGDGLANDRAFVANPVTARDTALAAQMSTLLATAPGNARRCLSDQLGAIAGANSCRTPWQAQLDLNLAFTPPQSIGAGSRLRFTTTFLNAGGALVRLFGLENTPLGQSPASADVDSRLLTVTGFDPVDQRFIYKVNQLFGQPIDYGTARHRYPPFELQIGVEYRFGYPPTAQVARSIGVFGNGRDTVGMAEVVRQRLQRSFGGNPVAEILAIRDSLALTADQGRNVEKVNAQYVAQSDSLLAPVVIFAVKRGRKLTVDELSARTASVGTAMRNLRQEARERAISYLLPEQRTKVSTLTRGY